MQTNVYDDRTKHAEWVPTGEVAARVKAYRLQSDAADMTAVAFSRIMDLVHHLPPVPGIEEQDGIVLAYLASRAADEMAISDLPLVFAGNLELGSKVAMRPRKIVRSLERLEAAGLIVMLGDRDGQRRRASDVLASNCIDLRILIARFSELAP